MTDEIEGTCHLDSEAIPILCSKCHVCLNSSRVVLLFTGGASPAKAPTTTQDQALRAVDTERL